MHKTIFNILKEDKKLVLQDGCGMAVLFRSQQQQQETTKQLLCRGKGRTARFSL